MVLALLGLVGLRKRRMDESGEAGSSDAGREARMSDTFFTAAPHWTWWIILYFFIGGIAGTAFMLAALLDVFGGSTSGVSASSAPSASRVVRLGYYLAFIGVLISGFLLTVDLTRPLRFWHMLIENHTGKPMFKAWEPMSIGAWALLLFGLFSFLAAVAALSEDRPNLRLLQSAPVRFLRRRGPSVVARGTGEHLRTLYRRLHRGAARGHQPSDLGRLPSTRSAIPGLRRVHWGGGADLLGIRRRAVDPATLSWLIWFDRNVLILELVVLIAFLISLGSVARVFLGWWGLVLLVGVSRSRHTVTAFPP